MNDVQTQLENEAEKQAKNKWAVSIVKNKRKYLNKAADELILQLGARSIDIAKSTAILCLANAIAVYEREGG